MKKLVLILALLALTVSPGLASAGGFHAGFHDNRSKVQAQFFWRPFFYAGPFIYGYPAGGTVFRAGRIDTGASAFHRGRWRRDPLYLRISRAL